MSLSFLLNDQNIALFLEKIPSNQQIITLKQLIYIGIKIVTNSFIQRQDNKKSKSNKKLPSKYQNKQNTNFNDNRFLEYQQKSRQKNNKSLEQFKKDQGKQNFSKNNQNKTSINHNIESSVLRQISKIRIQLQSLTNRVYDRYFEQNEHKYDIHQMNEENDFNENNSNRFNSGQHMHDFSANSVKQPQNISLNPFTKQKNNFFATQPAQVQKTETRNTKNLLNKGLNQLRRNEEDNLKNKIAHQIIMNTQSIGENQRNRAKSNVMHLDDTQIRQALYNDEGQIRIQQSQKKRMKKSQSMIQKRREEKKKDQQNYFYQLAIQKKRVEELEKIKKQKNQMEPAQRDFNPNLKPEKVSSQLNAYKKKAKSKIKKLVERDRLRYQQKVEEYNFKKGFEQYEYSANQFQDEDDNQKRQNGQLDSQNDKDPLKQGKNRDSSGKNVKSEKKQCRVKQNKDVDMVKYNKSQFESMSKNPNFGFYSSLQNVSPSQMHQNTFSNNPNQHDGNSNPNYREESSNRNYPEESRNPSYNALNNLQEEEDNINVCSNSSSFSQFSMSGSSRREVGKISRKRQD